MKKPMVQYAPKSSTDIKWDKKPNPTKPGEPTPGHGKVPNKTKMPKSPGDETPQTTGVMRGKVGMAVRKNETDADRIKRLQAKMMSRAAGPAREQLRKRIAGLKKRSGAMKE
jgi:hypothetical protein